jgi:hypothetical protein
VRDELEDAQALDTALAGGVQAILSALGPSFGNPAGTPIARGYAAVLSAIRRMGVKRLIPLGTPSIADEHDGRSVVYAAMVAAVSLGARSAYGDIIAVGEVIRRCDGVEWTIARMPVLKNDKNREVRAGYIGDGGAGSAYTLVILCDFSLAQTDTTMLWLRERRKKSRTHVRKKERLGH